MQAIIMAAGKGSRLGALTEEKPKCFLEINGIKIIEFLIALLHEKNIYDIVLVTGYKHNVIEDYLKDIEGLTFVYNPFYEFVNVLGSFFVAQDMVKNDDLIFMHADTLCAPDIFEEMLQTAGDMVLPVDFKECDEEAMKVMTQNGKLIAISKQIPCSQGEGEFIGIAKICKNVLPDLKAASLKLMEQKAFHSYFEGAVAELINDNKYLLQTIDIRGRFWGEIDFEEDYQGIRQRMPQELIDIAIKYRKKEPS